MVQLQTLTSPPAEASRHQRIREFPQGVVEVTVKRAGDVEEALNRAVMLVLDTAIERKAGILVTRMNIGRYRVQVCAEVPVGLTRERKYEVTSSHMC